MTNQTPADARERFLNPSALIPPRQINAAISQRTERAVLWAMALHPEERPESAAQFRDSLLGDLIPVSRPAARGANGQNPARMVNYSKMQPEQTLIWICAGLALVSLLATLAR